MTDKKGRILALIDEARKGYDLYEGQFIALERGYLNRIDPELLKDLVRRRKSHIAPQIIKAKVRKVVVSVLKTYFESEEFARLTPMRSSEESLEEIAKVQKALDMWTTKRINLYSRFKPVIIDALVYGTPIVKIYWKEGLKVERVRIKDLYIDPNAQSVFDIQYCVHRVRTTVGRLRRQYGKRFKWRNYIGQTGDGENLVSTADLGDASRIEVLDVYRFDGKVWRVSTVLPDEEFIRIDTPLKDGLPFVIGNVEPQFVSIDGEQAVHAYGGSFIEAMIPLQEEYTVTRNQQIDAIDKQLNPQFLSTKTSGLKEQDLLSNRKKILVSNLQEVQQLPVPSIDQSRFSTDRLDGEMQEVSGITKYNQGINDKANLNQTATGVSILTQEGNAIIEDIIRALNESLFEPAIRRMVTLIYRYDVNPDLYGLDRSKEPKFFVKINAGVGAVNTELLLNNITAAENTLITNIKIFGEIGDAQSAVRSARALNQLAIEKMKALRLSTIIPILKGDEDDERDDEPYDPYRGGFAPAEGDEGFGGLPTVPR